MPTSYTQRTPITTSYNTRPWISYIMTEVLDFLCTEDDDFLITDESIWNTYWIRTIPTTNYTTRIPI